MEKYIKERKAHLKKVEMEYFDRSVDSSINPMLRRTYRNFSNEFYTARRELEMLEQFLNSKTESITEA